MFSVPVWSWVQSSPTLSSDTSQERRFGSFRGAIQVGGPSVLAVVMAVLILYHCGQELLRSLLREMMSRLGSVRQFGTTGPTTLFGGVLTVQPFWACSRGEVSGFGFRVALEKVACSRSLVWGGFGRFVSRDKIIPCPRLFDWLRSVRRPLGVVTWSRGCFRTCSRLL